MAENSKLPNATKHGAYCKSALLPGESASDLKRLHLDLIDEYNPQGASEYHIVADLARLIWRKENLTTYDLAKDARKWADKIRSSADPEMTFVMPGDKRTREQVQVARQAAEKAAREQLSKYWDLIEIGEVATTDHLLKELSVIERLDGLIEKCLKELLMVRGVKSMTIHHPTPRC